VRPFITPPPIVERSIVMSICLSVCLSVCLCLFTITSSELHLRSKQFFCACCRGYGRGSVLLWRRSDTLCRPTVGFVDDVTFAHKPRLLDSLAVS